MPFTVLLVAASILVPAPTAKLEGWTGQIVMPKRSAVPYRLAKDGTQYDGRLMMIEYRVLQDVGTDIVLSENGKEVRVRKEDMVPQSEAVVFYSELIQNETRDAMPFAFRGWANKQQKSLDNALRDYGKAIELAPNQCAWRNNRALIWVEKKDYLSAVGDYDEAIRLFPQYALGYRNRGNCWLKLKEYGKALTDFQKGIELGPEIPAAHSSLARLLATCPDEKIRDGKQALASATKACELSDWKNGSLLDTLAAAYAEVGKFDEAIKYQEKAFADPYFATEKEKADEARQRLRDYRDKKPFREEPK